MNIEMEGEMLIDYSMVHVSPEVYWIVEELVLMLAEAGVHSEQYLVFEVCFVVAEKVLELGGAKDHSEKYLLV